MRVEQSFDELAVHLPEQIGFLESHCVRFDEGNSAFAKLIASSLRLLLHDTRLSRSLLGQLSLVSQMQFLDTAGPLLNANLATTLNLTMIHMTTVDKLGNTVAEFKPAMDNYRHRSVINRTSAFGRIAEAGAGRRLSFEKWWNMPVIRDVNRADFTRRDLVLFLANQDGGSHVDRGLVGRYHQLSRLNSAGFTVGNERPLGSPVPSSVRQIAHEFLNSAPSTFSR